MAGVWMKDGVEAIQAAGLAGFSNLKVRLFKNNYTPAKGDAVGSITEADFTGYTAQTVAAFSGQAWDATNKLSTETAGTATFTQTGTGTTNNVYGAYLTGDWSGGTGVLLMAERFSDAPVAMDTTGKSLLYTPVHTEQSQNG